MDWISKPVALWDWDNNPLPPPPSPSVTIAAFPAEDLSSVDDAPPPPAPAPPAPQLGLGLGKRTYFEGEKRAEKRGGGGTRCQVEGCGADLSAAKDYHRKHRVCEGHSKCPKVVVAGQERRFCQQCSRFHALAAFDQKKRSCRRRLSDHNARRRKPQPDSFSFSSSRLSSPFYDERRQISFMWNKAPFQILRQTQQASWADESDFKISNSKEFQMKPCNPNPNLLNPFPIAEGFKGSPPIQVLNQGPEARAPDNNLRRALSLLSSSSQSSPLQNSKNTPASPAWRDPASSLLHFSSTPSPPPVQAATLAASNSSYWFDEDQAASFSVQNGSNGGVHFQEFRVLKPAAVQYETAAFFDSSQIR
ncbi:hypothetical protein LUZ60_017273 [Juncus effusus]|nr:hypothetical protein LUZ60_017273 [Juncus effusus]